MKKKTSIWKKILAATLTLALVVGLWPGGILRANAAPVYTAVYRITKNGTTGNARAKVEKSTDDGVSFTEVTSNPFPIIINAAGNYKFIGDYVERPTDPNLKANGANTTAQTTPISTTDSLKANNNLACTGPGTGASGIVVTNPSAGTMNVKITMENLGLYTLGDNASSAVNNYHAALSIGAANTSPYKTVGNKVSCQIELVGDNFLWSHAGAVGGKRAGVEILTGSTVYLQGNGKLVGKATNTRGYSGYSPTTAQEGPYYDQTAASLIEPNGNIGSQVDGNGTGGGGAGIGSGNIYPMSSNGGGSVVIRGDATVVGICAAHSAGIGGGWQHIYIGNILIYGNTTVESWGGGHGAGIGGGCYGGSGTIVALPTAKVKAASYDGHSTEIAGQIGRPNLGQMGDVTYFGDPTFPKFTLATEDYRETTMYMDLTGNAKATGVIEALAPELEPTRLELGKTKKYSAAELTPWRNNLIKYKDKLLSDTTQDAYLLQFNAKFTGNKIITFFTEAKTDKNFSFDPVSFLSATNGSLTKHSTESLYPKFDQYNSATSTSDYYYGTTGGSGANYDYTPRGILSAPTYAPKVSVKRAKDPVNDSSSNPIDYTLASNYNPGVLYTGFNAAEAAGEQIEISFSNAGNQPLYNPTIKIAEKNNLQNYYVVGDASMRPLQQYIDEVVLQPGALLDATGAFIPVTNPAHSVTIKLELKTTPPLNQGNYGGFIEFDADNTPQSPELREFKIDVKKYSLPAATLTTPSTEVNGQFTVTADFKHLVPPTLPATNVWPVKDLNGRFSSVADAFYIQNGTIVGTPRPIQPIGSPTTVANEHTKWYKDSSNVNYYSRWEIDIEPTANLANGSTVTVNLRAGGATDQRAYNTSADSNLLVLTYNKGGPEAFISVAEGATVSSLNTLTVNFETHSKAAAPNKERIFLGSTYTQMESSSATALTSLTGNMQLWRDGTQLTYGTDYRIEIAGDKELKIIPRVSGSDVTLFPTGTYRFVIPANYVYNFERNSVAATTRTFSVRPADITAINVSPTPMSYKGGQLTITVSGTSLKSAGSNLKLVLPLGFNIAGMDPSDNTVTIPSSKVADDGLSATYTVPLPANYKMTTDSYAFTARLVKAGDVNQDVTTPNNTAVVSAALPTVDDGNGTSPSDPSKNQGLSANPAVQDYKGGSVQLTVKGENLYQFNEGAYSNLRVQVYKNGSSTVHSTASVSTPRVLGETSVDVSVVTDRNNGSTDDTYEYQLWVTDSGTPRKVLIVGSGSPVTASGIVKDATPKVDAFAVSNQSGAAGGSATLTLDDAGGNVYFSVNGLNLQNYNLSVSGSGPLPLSLSSLADSALTRSGTDNEKAISNIAIGIPANKTQADHIYSFTLNATPLTTGSPVTLTVTITVKKPEMGVKSIAATPAKFPAAGAHTSAVDLTGLHMDVLSTVEVRVDELSSLNHNVTGFTNNGANASFNMTFPAWTGGLRNDIYTLRVYSEGVDTGLSATVEVGDSLPNITGASINPNYYANVEATMNGKGRSVITIDGNYLENFQSIQIYDAIYDTYYTVNKTGCDQTTAYTVSVPSAIGVFQYDIWADGANTGHYVQVGVGEKSAGVLPPGDNVGDPNESRNSGGGNLPRKGEWAGGGGIGGGGSKGGSFTGRLEVGWEVVEYQSNRAGLANPKNPQVTLANIGVFTRKHFDMAASGAKAGAASAETVGDGILTVRFDTSTPDSQGKLEGRMYIKLDQPVPDVFPSVYTRDEYTKETKALFQNRFGNKNIGVVHLDQNGTFGVAEVEIAAAVNLTGMNTTKLYIYRLDRKTGAFEQVTDSRYYIDTAGYLHFFTKVGGDFVVADSPLTESGQSVTKGSFAVESLPKTLTPALEAASLGQKQQQ